MSAAAEAYTGRDNAVPCREIGCRRTTWRDDARCDHHADLLASRSPAVDDGGDASTPPGRVPATPLRVSQTTVAAEPRTPEWVAYHQAVIDDAHGVTSHPWLADDPYRWAAHLGCAIGELVDRLDSMPRKDPRHRTLRHARVRLVARKGDAVAARKRTLLAQQAGHAEGKRMQLAYALRQILERTDESGPYALLDIADLARDALGITPLDDNRPAQGSTQ